jgi:hypothetical protein
MQEDNLSRNANSRNQALMFLRQEVTHLTAEVSIDKSMFNTDLIDCLISSAACFLRSLGIDGLCSDGPGDS